MRSRFLLSVSVVALVLLLVACKVPGTGIITGKTITVSADADLVEVALNVVGVGLSMSDPRCSLQIDTGEKQAWGCDLGNLTAGASTTVEWDTGTEVGCLVTGYVGDGLKLEFLRCNVDG
jgi:hypothetical protein